MKREELGKVIKASVALNVLIIFAEMFYELA